MKIDFWREKGRIYLKENKLTQVKFRLTAEELDLWQKKANERNLSLPKFSKQIVNQAVTLGKLKQPKVDKDQGAEIIKQLAKLGGNVNQLAKWCNTNKINATEQQIKALDSNLERVQEELKLIWQQLK